LVEPDMGRYWSMLLRQRLERVNALQLASMVSVDEQLDRSVSPNEPPAGHENMDSDMGSMQRSSKERDSSRSASMTSLPPLVFVVNRFRSSSQVMSCGPMIKFDLTIN